MKTLIKPPRLKAGDVVATVSLSSGIAGDVDVRHRYEQGKRRMQEVFGLRVVEMPHTLAGSEYLYAHPEKRAEDLMAAFRDPEIRAVVSCTGGNDSIRLLPYVDFDLIAANPKIYSGFSDSTVTHFMCYKAGLSSLYGPSVLSDFAENVQMCPYTVAWLNKLWFSPKAPGRVPASPTYSAHYLPWLAENAGTARNFYENTGYDLVQGQGVAEGPLIGGCLEVLNQMVGTALFPPAADFEGAILFLETSEERPPEWLVEDFFRSLVAMDILPKLAGILFAKPQAGDRQLEYHTALKKVLAECGRGDMPVLGNASFGHNEPRFPLPFGARAQINCEDESFSILEEAVV